MCIAWRFFSECTSRLFEGSWIVNTSSSSSFNPRTTRFWACSPISPFAKYSFQLIRRLKLLQYLSWFTSIRPKFSVSPWQFQWWTRQQWNHKSLLNRIWMIESCSKPCFDSRPLYPFQTINIKVLWSLSKIN